MIVPEKFDLVLSAEKFLFWEFRDVNPMILDIMNLYPYKN